MAQLSSSKETTSKSKIPPVLSFHREDLFPKDVAAAYGLDPNSFCILEVPNGSTTLYCALLLYAANFAVDINPLVTQDPVSSDETSTVSTVPTEKEACEPSVSANQNSAAKPSSKESTSRSEDVLYVRAHNGVQIPRREGPGHLSTLWNCPEDRSEPRMSDSDTGHDPDSDTDSDSDSDSDNGGSEPSDGENSGERKSTRRFSRSLRDYASLGALSKKVSPPLQRFQMGLGYAKVNVGEHTVIIRHYAYGLPVSEGFSVQIFRSVVLACSEEKPLQELCAVALTWRADRDLKHQRARPGRFTLFRFKTNGDGCGDWNNQGYKRSRPAKSVILEEGQLEEIVRDIKDFVQHETKVWYEAHGLPHRRSYLFHGPPGCGKTSTIKMIAGMFRLSACFLSLTAADFSNQVLQDALASVPRRALLVLEDVDVLFNEDRKSEVSQALTFSGLLNALDGLVSVDGVITIFTTNHIDKLDPALIRGGRVDRRFEFVHPNSKQMCALFKSFYEDAPCELAQRFADIVLSRPEEEARSIATLQQHFIFTRKFSAEASVEMIPKFFEAFYPKGGRLRNTLYI